MVSSHFFLLDFILRDLENFALISTRAELILSPGFQLILGVSG